MTLRIGFDAKRAFHNKSGLGNYSRGVIDLLAKYYPQNQYFLYSQSGKSNFNSTKPEKTLIRNPEYLIDRLFPALWRSYGITDQLKRDKIDLYHGLSNEIPLNIHISSISTIVTIHDLIFMRFPKLYKAWDRRIYEKKFRYSCKVADRIISISDQTKYDIVNYFEINENKIETVYQSCNKIFKEKANLNKGEKIKLKYNLPQEYILYVGTIEKRKNLLNVIKALKISNTDIPLVVVGRPTNYLDEIKKYIADNRLNHKINFYHDVPTTDLPSIYQEAKLFIYPSVFEGFGIPIIEALYSGTPVITSKGSCFSEAGGPDSIYIDPYSPEEISDSIVKVLDDTNLQNKMITMGMSFVKKFDDAIVADNIMKVYNTVGQH